jgi:hypothetical protein
MAEVANRNVELTLFRYLTQLSMRVQAPPFRCRSESIAPRLATGSQGSEAGLNGGAWEPQSGHPV